MSGSRPFEQARIQQLISDYSPDTPPLMTLDFGDYLSLLWRLDRSAEHLGRVRYYRRCVLALGAALDLRGRSVYRLVEVTPPGDLYAQLPNAPYRGTTRLVDAQDRKAAISQLVRLRADMLAIGTTPEAWGASFPGSGIVEVELRERVFAVLFTALQGQFAQFGRLLFVVDIVLANLLIGSDSPGEVDLTVLIQRFDYPHPSDAGVRREFYAT